MTVLNISVRIETADDAAAETAYQQVKTALSGFDDIQVRGSVVKRKTEMRRVAGKAATVRGTDGAE